MTALSEISLAAVCPAPGPPVLTDGAIAALNLQAQIDGLDGHGTSAEAATLIDLLILRGLILGRISDYERAAQLADRLVHNVVTDAAAHVARARTRAVFHRFSEALDDLDHADRISPQGAAAKQERAAILQALGCYDEALVVYEDAADRGGNLNKLAPWPACGPTAAKPTQRSAFTSTASARTAASLRFRWRRSTFSWARCG
jgi:tetratricopeptide (TPR) repeat protein